MLLGYDIGTSSVKVSLLDTESGKCAATSTRPRSEAVISSPRPGWAEQDPDMWWDNMVLATRDVMEGRDPGCVSAIGLSYQMHGLVCVDKGLRPLRPAIIWCDSRAVPYGDRAFRELGEGLCLEHLLNSPGNFTASKLAWVKENEPETYGKIWKIMLPGDYIAARMCGEAVTTVSGLSEGMFWDFKENRVADFLLDYFGFDGSFIPRIVPTFGDQGRISAEAASQLGLKEGTPICYRAGDQPNNALSLSVLEPGEIAATAGTSGIIYGVNSNVVSDPASRVNTFAHVNHSGENPRLGVLLCISSCGILNSWIRRNVAPEGMTYDQMNAVAEEIPVGCDGVHILPFGNGAERMLGNRMSSMRVSGVDFNRHSWKHLVRAAQEGVVFAFKYGMDIMGGMGIDVGHIHAGFANMFLSPVFRETFAGVTGAVIDLYDTDGSLGAARGAGLGAGIYADTAEAFSSLERISTTEPGEDRGYTEAYQRWKEELNKTSA